MDRQLSSYFCIFCHHLTLSSMSSAYNHYKSHMKRFFYCPACELNEHCGKDHSQEMTSSPQSESEEGVIEMWIERFLAFQGEFIGKPYADFFKATKMFSGCIVCETFMKVCKNDQVDIDREVLWSSCHSYTNDRRHMCSHLRYYSYECIKCEMSGKYHKTCDLNEITRHVKAKHRKTSSGKSIDNCIKTVKVRKLENLLDKLLSSNEKSPYSSPETVKPKLLPQPISPIRSSKRIMNLVQSPKQSPPEGETASKRPRVETKTIFINTDIRDCIVPDEPSTKFNVNQKKNIILSVEKQRPETSSPSSQKMVFNRPHILSQRTSDSATIRPEIVFKPIVKINSSNLFARSKTSRLISGDQIIIKSVDDRPRPPTLSFKPISIIRKAPKEAIPPPLTRKPDSSLTQQFSDMMDYEEPNKIQKDHVSKDILQKMDYFCVFCPKRLANRDEAVRHIQIHVDYLPIVCLTCGEALTDIQTFMKHHRQLHPNAVKGKYKKKEQPQIDKWISSFLYSQATLIRSFPPRETCPVCDVIYTKAEVQKNKPRRCTINRKIDHVYRHLSYLPYECILCRQSGQPFLVAYFESKAHSHIKLKHPEIDETEERWNVFQKTITIPKLDEFINFYLEKNGIAMGFERRPVKKNKEESQTLSKIYQEPRIFVKKRSIASIARNKSSDSSLNLNMIFSDIMESNSEDSIELERKETEVKAEVESEVLPLNQTNNDSNDSNIVVNVCPTNMFGKDSSDEKDNGIEADEEEKDLFFCIFCPDHKLHNKMEAYSHYGSHLKYNPVLCKICSQSFADTDLLMAHHQSAHSSQANVDYEIREDQILMRWVNEFLDCQKSINKVMPCSCSYNCPVCVKLIGTELSAVSVPCVQHNDVAFSVHIYKHLNYFPYECMACKRNNISIRVPNLDVKAMDHLKKHNIANPSMYQVVKCFPKTLVISSLEKLIEDSVNRKRLSEKKIKNESLNGSKINAPEDVNDHNISEDSLSPISLMKQQHIRMEGGRIVNWPDMHSKTVTGRAINMPNGTHKQTIYISCTHCRQSFVDRNHFKLHHQRSHPGKQILFKTRTN